MRGNVLDLAVGVIIGGAFGKITASLVSDVIMPIVGLALGKVQFNQLFINLSSVPYETLAAAEAAGAPVLKYGAFIDTIVNFLIISFCIFVIIKLVNRLSEFGESEAKRKAAEAAAVPPPPSKEELLLTEIRDLLKAQQNK